MSAQQSSTTYSNDWQSQPSGLSIDDVIYYALEKSKWTAEETRQGQADKTHGAHWYRNPYHVAVGLSKATNTEFATLKLNLMKSDFVTHSQRLMRTPFTEILPGMPLSQDQQVKMNISARMGYTTWDSYEADLRLGQLAKAMELEYNAFKTFVRLSRAEFEAKQSTLEVVEPLYEGWSQTSK